LLAPPPKRAAAKKRSLETDFDGDDRSFDGGAKFASLIGYGLRQESAVSIA
jgi:hypothetical protein